jgi:osmotically inducible lipoprotein OsmB
MKKLVLLIPLALALSACGHQFADRTLSGAGIGAGAGAVLGPIGAGAGAVIGGAVGAVTPASKVNLGKPVWNK